MKQKKQKTDGQRAPVRVSVKTHRRLLDLKEAVALRGWKSLGSNRTDEASFDHLIEEAVGLLEAKAK